MIVKSSSQRPRGSGPQAAVRIASTTAALALLLATWATTPVAAAGLPRGNFVVHAATPRAAEMITEHAEHVRARIFATILGTDQPPAWEEVCEIHVHATPESFAAAVGGPPAAARGATSIEFAGDDVSLRRVDVMGEEPAAIPDALAHELVHVVLAERFTLGPPPRWADEGLALLFDPLDKQQGHEADVQTARRRDIAFSAADLLTLETYPDSTGRQRVFYGQSGMLIRWLLARGDMETLLRFVEECGDAGIEPALERHYRIGSVTELEAAWETPTPILESPLLVDGAK